MANLEELDTEDLQMLHGGLMVKLASYRLERTERERLEVAQIGRLVRMIDKALDEAFEAERGFIAGASQYHFENMKEGRI